MVEPADWYSLISVSTSALALLLAAYVLKRVPNRRAGDTFALAMVFFFLAAVFAYLLRTSGGDSPETSLALAHVFYFCHMLAVGFTAAFIGSYFYGFKVMGRRTVVLFLQVSLFVVAFFVSSLVTVVAPWPPYGVTVDTTDATLALAFFATVYMTTALGVLVRTLIVSRDTVVRKQALVMTLGILGHGVGAESYAYLRLSGGFPAPFLTITALLMASTFALAVLKFQMFVVVPKKEDRLDLTVKFPVRPGHAYVVEEAAPETLQRAFDEAIRRGVPGLLATRRNPASVREENGWTKTPILWITDAPGQNRVAPGNPAMLERLVLDFVAQAPASVVGLHGFESVAREVGTARALKTVQLLRDAVTAGGGVFLLSLHPSTADAEVAPFLEREFEALPVPPPEGSGVEDVFVIEANTGILLARKERSAASVVDADLMAGMLTAIMDFAKTSFAHGDDQLRDLTLGERRVALERGARVIVAAVYRGREPPDVHAEMRSFVQRAEARYGPVLAAWNGDIGQMQGLQVMAGRLLV